jgi:putative ABC transport system permease protein
MFSVVNGVLLAELPYRDPSRLVLFRVSTDGQTSLPSLAPPEIEDVRERTDVFEDVSSIRGNTGTLTGVGEPLQLRIGAVRWNFLRLLGVEPLAGRAFSAEDGLPNAAPVVLLGHGLWQERFGGDPAVVGRSIVLDGQSTLVAGVLPADVELLLPREAGLPKRLDAWRPFNFDFHEQPRFRWMRAVARLKPEVGLLQAQQAIDRLTAELTAEYPAYRLQPLLLVVRQGLGLASLGILVGVAAALALSRVLASLLYGLSPADPLTYLAIVAGVAGQAMLASWVPAQRASQLHPGRVLRSE